MSHLSDKIPTLSISRFQGFPIRLPLSEPLLPGDLITCKTDLPFTFHIHSIRNLRLSFFLADPSEVEVEVVSNDLIWWGVRFIF